MLNTKFLLINFTVHLSQFLLCICPHVCQQVITLTEKELTVVTQKSVSKNSVLSVFCKTMHQCLLRRFRRNYLCS